MSISNSQILEALYCLAPQFITDDPDTLLCYENIIALVRCQVSANVLKCCGILAYVYLLAHMLTLRLNPLIGVSNSLREGDLSIGLAVDASGSILNSTSYGKAYQDLIKRTVVGVFNSNVPSNLGLSNGSCGCSC